MIFAEASGSRLTGFKVTNFHEVAFQTSCHFHKIAESTVPYNNDFFLIQRKQYFIKRIGCFLLSFHVVIFALTLTSDISQNYILLCMQHVICFYVFIVFKNFMCEKNNNSVRVFRLQALVRKLKVAQIS